MEMTGQVSVRPNERRGQSPPLGRQRVQENLGLEGPGDKNPISLPDFPIRRRTNQARPAAGSGAICTPSSSSGSKPTLPSVREWRSWYRQTLSLSPGADSESPVWTPIEEGFESLTGVESPVGKPPRGQLSLQIQGVRIVQFGHPPRGKLSL